MDKIEKDLLKQIADIEKTPMGAYNIRENGKGVARNTTANIDIVTKTDKPGIDIIIKPNTKNESVHIPVILTQGGLNDLVYNDFYIGENCNVLIVAGCGIHNSTCKTSMHNGIHSFKIGKNSFVKYVEKHVGEGSGSGGKILNPVTRITLSEGASMEIETLQLEGVTSTVRKTQAKLYDNATLKINENILTTLDQTAKTDFKVDLIGKNSSVEVVSHSVAKDNSYQVFKSNLVGKNECFGHVECDGIITDNARIISVPMIDAVCSSASLIHEAAIGKIAGEELVKLMTLGLGKEEAENKIIEGFLIG